MSSYESLPLQELENDLVEEDVEYLERDEELFYGSGYDFNLELEDDFFEDANCSEDHLEPVKYPYSLPGYDVEYPEPDEDLFYCSGCDFNHELEDDFVDHLEPVEYPCGLPGYDVEYPELDEDLFYGAGYDFYCELEDDFVDHLESVEYPYGFPRCDRNLPIDPNLNFDTHMKVFHDISTRNRRLMESIKNIIINLEGIERGISTNTERIIGASVRNSHLIENGEDTKNIVDPEAQRRRNTTGYCSEKIDLEKIAAITNVVLEILSAVFDQLSSMRKPRYALVSMLPSFVALLIYSIELVYKARKERVTWKRRSRLPWLYYPSQTHKPFGNFKDIIGLVCAICQCIVTTISFDFLLQQGNNPIKVYVLPIIYATGLLWSKFLEKP